MKNEHTLEHIIYFYMVYYNAIPIIFGTAGTDGKFAEFAEFESQKI